MLAELRQTGYLHVTEAARAHPVQTNGLRASVAEGEALALPSFQGDQVWSRSQKDWALLGWGVGGTVGSACYPTGPHGPQSFQLHLLAWLILRKRLHSHSRWAFAPSLRLSEILLPSKCPSVHFAHRRMAG